MPGRGYYDSSKSLEALNFHYFTKSAGAGQASLSVAGRESRAKQSRLTEFLQL